MKKLLLTLLALFTLVMADAQTAYISNSRDEGKDYLEDLNGRCGILLTSVNKNLMINVTNASKKFEIIRPEGKNSEGMYEYRILIGPDDTRDAKVEVNRMSDVYKTDFIANVKPDFFVAYKIEEVSDPIRIEDQTQRNDAVLKSNEAALEFTTTIKDLTIKCDPRLKATMTTAKSKADATVDIISVEFPIEPLQAVRDTLNNLTAEYDRLTQLINADKATDEDWDRSEEVEKAIDKARANLRELSTVTIFSTNTNRLSIEISEMGPRSKKCYIVMPVEITKEVFVTEASAYVTEGGRLFDQRKYADARVAYVNAINSKDVDPSMRPTINASIALCDTCLQYEKYAAASLGKIMEMKKNNTATQQQVARYAAAAVEFLGIVNDYNPDIFYTTRINQLNKVLESMPLNITFTTVEWRTFGEGAPIPDVEAWAYYGDATVLPSTYATPRKFRKTINAAPESYKQEGLSDAQGKIQVQLDRKNLPSGFLFFPSSDKDIKAVYLSLNEFMRRAEGTYLEKQFRLKMYKRTNKFY